MKKMLNQNSIRFLKTAYYKSSIIGIFSFLWLYGAQIHVAVTGNDTNSGTQLHPYSTISKAASVAQPGDEIIVHQGTYREWVKPPRGGLCDTQRIVYKAAPGEQVYIKGSNQITSWVAQGGGVWMVTLDDTCFHGYNPYALVVQSSNPYDANAFMSYGQWHHRGDVYLNGEAFFERQTLAEVQTGGKSWYTEVAGGTTKIWANFGSINPDSNLAEINVRQSVIFPDVAGLKYITIDGFNVLHSADEWAASNGGAVTQWGAIGPRWGYGWIIQNCHIANARCNGICLGSVQGASRGATITWGHHIVRNNHINRCGQTGIVGDGGNCVSLIDNNLIEDINYRNEFGGWENAGIKFHYAVDVTISNNCIRRVHGNAGNYGIWIDWEACNVRISGNCIYANQGQGIDLEVLHGPILIDNNFLLNNGVQELGSEACVFVHNYFYNSPLLWFSDTQRSPSWFYPHAFNFMGSAPADSRDVKIYNNIFVMQGDSGAPNAQNLSIDYNVYMQKAPHSAFDTHSKTDTALTNLSFYSDTNKVTAAFAGGTSAFSMSCPFISNSFIGSLSRSNMTLQTATGTPISINVDYFNNPIQSSDVIPGPFQNLSTNKQTYNLWPKNQATAISNPANHFTKDAPEIGLRQIGQILLINQNGEFHGISEITLTNALGVIVKKFVFSNTAEQALSLKGLAKGVYIVTELCAGRPILRSSLITYSGF